MRAIIPYHHIDWKHKLIVTYSKEISGELSIIHRQPTNHLEQLPPPHQDEKLMRLDAHLAKAKDTPLQDSYHDDCTHHLLWQLEKMWL